MRLSTTNTSAVTEGLGDDGWAPASLDYGLLVDGQLWLERFANTAPYEVLPASGAARLLTLTGAHPSARVVRDAARVAAAERRLIPAKP